MNKDYIQTWIDLAIEDLEVSKILFENEKFSNSFYHFQQASEKGLKAYAFMIKTYTSEKDANNTGHFTLKVFIDSVNERQKEIAFLKDYEFEKLIVIIAKEQKEQKGCIDIKYVKRFYVFDDIKEQPRELTKIVKCVKYFSYWEFDNLENYSNATHWLFDKYSKEIFKLLIMPFDINCGNSIY